MRIGVVCEGPSDYPAIEHFVGVALADLGISATFRSLHPEMDRTRPTGGWASVLTWFKRYTAQTRIQKYFNGGLFGGDLGEDHLDAILVHLDSDVLEDVSFKKFVLKEYGVSIVTASNPRARAQEVEKVLAGAAEMSILSSSDRKRHVFFPAIESTEAWCVSAFSGKPIKANYLNGNALRDAFMSALEASEGKSPKHAYENVDKSATRRERFCKKHSKGAGRISRNCVVFRSSMRKLANV